MDFDETCMVTKRDEVLSFNFALDFRELSEDHKEALDQQRKDMESEFGVYRTAAEAKICKWWLKTVLFLCPPHNSQFLDYILFPEWQLYKALSENFESNNLEYPRKKNMEKKNIQKKKSYSACKVIFLGVIVILYVTSHRYFVLLYSSVRNPCHGQLGIFYVPQVYSWPWIHVIPLLSLKQWSLFQYSWTAFEKDLF